MGRFSRVFMTTGVIVGAIGAGAGEGVSQEMVMMDGGDRVLGVETEPIYSVGSITGAAWESFAELGSNDLGFDGAGNLYVLDGQNSRVVMIGPDGKLVKEIGRAGEGPGEFINPGSIAVNEDGSFTIFDIGHRGLMYFDADGEFIEQTTVPLESLPGSQIRPDGMGGVVSASGQGVVVMTRGGGSTPTEGAPINRYSMADGGTVQPLFSAWRPPPPEMASIGGGGAATFSIGGRQITAFEPDFMIDALPNGGVVVMDSLGYRLKIVSPEGGLDRILARPVEPRRVTERDRDRERQRRIDAIEDGEGPQFRINAPGVNQAEIDEQVKQGQLEQIENMAFAEVFPVLSAVKVDWEGRIWAERTGEDPNGSGPIDVISTSDEYVGTIPEGGIRMPRAFGPDGLVAWVEPDELDVPIIKVHRVRTDR